MSQARDLADLGGSASAGGITGRNLIINGAMQVWQRGTSLSITTSNFRIADRWLNFPGTGGGGTASQQVFTIGQTDVPGEPEYYLRHDQSTGASSNPNIQTRIENVRTGAGQSVTLSFYARVASGTLTIDPIIRQYFGTGGSPSTQVDNTPNDITVTTSWQRFTRTITLGSISGKTIGTDGNDQVQIRLELPTSTTFTLDIVLAQLELGDTATPFEHRSFGDELIQCQRYYTQTKSFTVEPGNQSTQGLCVLDTGVPMRARPTISLSGPLKVTDFGNTSTTQSSASVIHDGSSTDFANKYHLIRLQNFSGLNGRSWVSYLNSEYIILDAEL